MKLHVLAGDSLVEPFNQTNIEGEIIICRECLIDGDLKAKNLDIFWNVRETYLAKTYPKEPNFYQNEVKSEFQKLIANANGSEINLWFEYELFCQVNLWFCLSLLKNTKADIFIVYPILKDDDDIWKGFGCLNTDELKQSYERRIKLNLEDILLGLNLWEAFQNRDSDMLSVLGNTKSNGFPTLKEICKAAAEIETRPKKVLSEIISSGITDFGKAFQKFNKTEDIYGFGDLQVKKIFDHLREYRKDNITTKTA